MEENEVDVTEEIRKQGFRSAVLRVLGNVLSVMDDSEGVCILVNGKRMETSYTGKHTWRKANHAKSALTNALKDIALEEITKLIPEGRGNLYSRRAIYEGIMKELYDEGVIKIVSIKDFYGNG